MVEWGRFYVHHEAYRGIIQFLVPRVLPISLALVVLYGTDRNSELHLVFGSAQLHASSAGRIILCSSEHKLRWDIGNGFGCNGQVLVLGRLDGWNAYMKAEQVANRRE